LNKNGRPPSQFVRADGGGGTAVSPRHIPQSQTKYRLCYTTVMSLKEIRTRLRKNLPDLQQRYGVSDLWLFGSYVRHEQSQDSDLDVLVTFDNPHLSLIQFIQLEMELSELLGVKVDLVERDSLKPAISQHILHEVITV
jgi:uncharacterized protein